MNLDTMEDRLQAAGEYVLGVLEPAEAETFERALAGDEGLRSAVAWWEGRLAGLSDIPEPVPPSPLLWERVSGTLGGARLTRSPSAPSARTMTQVPLMRRLGFWQATTGFATAAAIVLAVIALVRPFDAAAPVYTAVLQSRDGAEAGYLIQADAEGNVTLRALETVSIASDRALQLWTLVDPAEGPVSLGLLQPGQSITVPADALPALGGGQLFEISVEPETGSPIGRPTGPVLYIGRTVALPD